MSHDPDANSAIKALESQCIHLQSQLVVESRKLANARFLAESFERQALAAQQAAAEAEARAQRSEAELCFYRETMGVRERERTLEKLVKSIGDGGAKLVDAEGAVRTCMSDPIINHPTAGGAQRRELAKLRARVAALGGRFESEKELLKVLGEHDARQRAAWVSAMEGDVERLERLVRSGCSVNAADSSGLSALHYACMHGRVPVLRLCLEHGGNVSSEYGSHTALGVAASHAQLGAVGELLGGARAGCDVDGVDGSGQTALHAAAAHGHVEICEALLDFGAHIDAIDAHGSTPLHLAVKNLRHQVITTLLERGADASRKDLHGRAVVDVVPPLPPVANSGSTLVPISLEDAERLRRATSERTEIRRLIAQHEALTRGALAHGTYLDDEDGGEASSIGEDGGGGGPRQTAGRAGPGETGAKAELGVFPVANVRLERSQQRTLTYMDRSKARRGLPAAASQTLGRTRGGGAGGGGKSEPRV